MRAGRSSSEPAVALKLEHLSREVVAARCEQADAALASALADETDGAAQRWLRDMPWKRVVAHALLGDLLAGSGRRVVEFGGGLSGLTAELARRHDYTLVELGTHEGADAYRELERKIGRSFVEMGDWTAFERPEAAVVVAIDLFPNVDQRLYEFAERFLPAADEVRLALTYYENTTFEVQRIGSGERLVVKPWGLAEIVRFVEYLGEAYGETCAEEDRAQLVYRNYEGEVFTNRRNVLLMTVDRR